MTLTKRAISLIVALMMVFSAVAMVASVSAGAEDATEATTDAVEQEELVYLQKFEEKDFAGWVSTKDMGFEAFDEDAETGTVTYNGDGSITIDKSEEYQQMLKKLYFFIRNYYNIPEIDWIIKT